MNKDQEFNSKRLPSLDGLRGLIMVLMALDHARFFVSKIHPLEHWRTPLPQYQDAISFLTRLSSHLCAPGFFFLMGISMILFVDARSQRGWSEGRLIRHFISRGLVLIILQQLIVNPAWFLGTMGSTTILGNAADASPVWFNLDVLFGLGLCMIVLVLFLRLNTWVILLISIGAIMATQILMPPLGNAEIIYSPLL